MNIVQTIIDGIALGALYALVAIGLALVFGVLRLINFAQGELITAGAYSLYVTRSLPLVASVAICFAVCTAIAFLMERIAFRPLRGASPATTLVASFAVAFALEALWLLLFSAQGKPADALYQLNRLAIRGSLDLRWVTVAQLGAGVLLLGGTALLLTRTDIGLQMRAAARDFRTARLLGIRTNAVISMAFVLSGVMAAVVALLFTVQQPLVTNTFGLNIVIIALIGAVVGGIERLWTATAGAFAAGFVTSVLASALPAGMQEFQTAWLFALLLLSLLVRPGGLFAPLRGANVERV